MSEPKHIPLPKRLREYAAAKAEQIRAALEAADDAHDVEGDEDEDEDEMDGPCDSCLKTYPSWFTDNPIWNQVMGDRASMDDPGGLLCPRCFMLRAERTFSIHTWRVIPAWKEPSAPEESE